MKNILREARQQIRPDFLILVNGGDAIPSAFVDYINGTYMETWWSDLFSSAPPSERGVHNGEGYSTEFLQRLERVLTWAENNVREPRINCLEGEGLASEPPDGPNNMRWMRVFTTLSLTHSDGYVLYTDGRRKIAHHAHAWYDFWDADLVRPVGEKAVKYQDIDGVFIREFTNGWAVYNRSGKAQTISLPQSVTGVSSGLRGVTHILPDLDGEMYLKTENPADVNGDSVVNILDLTLVA